MALPHPRPSSALIIVGSLTLDISARMLIGPSGSLRLHGGSFLILRAVMRCPGEVVEMRDVAATCWPDPDLQPKSAGASLRAKAGMARDALEHVGLSRTLLQTVLDTGWRLNPERHIAAADGLNLPNAVSSTTAQPSSEHAT